MALGWAIIGAGMHPQQKVAPSIGLTPDSELIAVLSRDQGRADSFAENHGAQVGYSNIDDLLADSRVDVVFVASPKLVKNRKNLMKHQGSCRVCKTFCAPE